MTSFRERIAWYRAENYLAQYKPYGIAVAGTYGREVAARAIAYALKSHRHIRSSGSIEHSIDIPEGILGAKGHREHGSIMQLLVRSKMRELKQFEPDTIITQLPLIAPGAAPMALHKILPRMLVLTHIGFEHLDLFVNKETILHEYAILANTLQKDAVVVLNADDASLREIQEAIARPVITYGVHSSADVRIARATRQEQGLFLEVLLHGVHTELFLPHLFAAQHVSAVAAGLAAAHGMNISVKDAAQGMRLMKPPKGNLTRVKGMQGITIIDDSANTCPEQLESSLQSFGKLPSKGRKIAVLGDMENLASLEIEKHEEVGKHAATIVPICIFVGGMMRHAQDAALKLGNGIDTHHFASSAEVSSWLPENIREGDMVFVSGGKSIKMDSIVKRLRGKQ